MLPFSYVVIYVGCTFLVAEITRVTFAGILFHGATSRPPVAGLTRIYDGITWWKRVRQR